MSTSAQQADRVKLLDLGFKSYSIAAKHELCVQDALDEREVSEEMRHRIMTFYRHKYEGGQYWHQESILQELPYDMQVRRPHVKHSRMSYMPS